MASNSFEQKFQRLQFGVKQQQAFLEDLSALLRDGVPINTAIETIEQIASGAIEHVARELALAIAKGQPLADGMTFWFTPAIVEFVRAGEESGTLAESITQAGAALARQKGALGEIISALLYPLIVLFGACGVFVFVKQSVFVNFIAIKPIAEWPSVGQTVYHLANFIEAWWWVVLIATVGLAVMVNVLLRTFTGKWRQWLDKIPGFSLYRRSASARVMETLGLLLKNGVALRRALAIMQQKAQPYLVAHLIQMEIHLSSGQDNIAEVLDTGLLSFSEMLRLRVIGRGRGFEAALLSLGEQAGLDVQKKIVRFSKIMGGVFLALGAGMAAMLIFSIYTIGASLAS